MPYFFVDGFRDNKPTTALYVQADNEEGALARAAELGMEGTGVRLAKEITVSEPAKSWTILVTVLLLACISYLERYSFQAHGKAYPDMLPALSIMIGMVIFRVYETVLWQYRQQQLMAAEIQELRLAVAQLQLNPR